MYPGSILALVAPGPFALPPQEQMACCSLTTVLTNLLSHSGRCSWEPVRSILMTFSHRASDGTMLLALSQVSSATYGLTGRRPAFSIHARDVRLFPQIPRRSKGPRPVDTSSTLQISPIHFLCDISRLVLSTFFLYVAICLGLVPPSCPPTCPWLPVTSTLLSTGLPEQSARFLPTSTVFKKDHIHVLPTFFSFLPLLWPTTDLLRTLSASGLQRLVSPQRLSLLALPIAYA